MHKITKNNPRGAGRNPKPASEKKIKGSWSLAPDVMAIVKNPDFKNFKFKTSTAFIEYAVMQMKEVCNQTGKIVVFDCKDIELINEVTP